MGHPNDEFTTICDEQGVHTLLEPPRAADHILPKTMHVLQYEQYKRRRRNRRSMGPQKDALLLGRLLVLPHAHQVLTLLSVDLASPISLVDVICRR